jgi:hypothetical protein
MLSRMERHQRSYYVYRLRCPVDNRIRYIGISTDPRKREFAHRSKAIVAMPAKREWISRLRDLRLKPLVEIVSPPLSYDEALAWELRLHFLFSTMYPQQLTCPPVHLRRQKISQVVLCQRKGPAPAKIRPKFFSEHPLRCRNRTV